MMKLLLPAILGGVLTATPQEGEVPEVDGTGWEHLDFASLRPGQWERVDMESKDARIPLTVTSFTWSCLAVENDRVRMQEHYRSESRLLGVSETVAIFEVSRKDGRTLRAWVRSADGTAVPAKLRPPPSTPPSEAPVPSRGRVSHQKILIDGVERLCEKIEIEQEMEYKEKKWKEQTLYWYCAELPARKLIRYRNSEKLRRRFAAIEWEGAPPKAAGRLCQSFSDHGPYGTTRSTYLAAGTDAKPLFEVK